MATQPVADKIIEDAQHEAQGILDHYKKEAEKIRAEYDKRISAKKEDINTVVAAAKKTELMRLISQKNLEFNKEIVAEKHKHILKIIGDAIKTLPEHKKYFSFLTTMITNSGEKEGELFISKHDMKVHGKKLEKFLNDQNYSFAIKVDSDMRGGVLIRKGKTVYHGSLDLISELLRDELTIAVSNKLF